MISLHAATARRLSHFLLAAGLTTGCLHAPDLVAANGAGSAKKVSQHSFNRDRIQARLQDHWRELSVPKGSPVKLAQRRLGDPVYGPTLGTVWVTESILSPDDHSKLVLPTQQEAWLKSLQLSLGIESSAGAWFGDQYFLFGVSPRHSRTFVHSIRVREGVLRFGAGFAYLAPQFHSVLRETFLLQANWMNSALFPLRKAASNQTPSVDALMNLWPFRLPEAHAQQLPRQVPGLPNVPNVPTPKVSILPSLPSIPAQQYMPAVNAILNQGSQAANKVIQSAAQKAAQAIQNATQSANGVVNNAANQTNASVNNAANQANAVVNNAATQSSSLIQQATQSAASLEQKLFVDTSNLLQQSGQILQATTSHAIQELTSVMGGTAAQVAIAATLGAGVADGMLTIGGNAIQYFMDWIKGVDDLRAFQNASQFLEAHAGLILTQRQRIASMLNSLEEVGELTSDRIDELSFELDNQSQFFQDREEYWKKALKLAAGKSNTSLYSKLHSCRKAEQSTTRVLSTHSSNLALTSEVLRAKIGNGKESSVKSLVCEQIDQELTKLVELETSTYQALGEYLEAHSTVSKQTLEDANDQLLECKRTGPEALLSTLDEAVNGFESIMDLNYCSEEWIKEQNQDEADYSHRSKDRANLTYSKCLAKQTEIVGSFKKIHGPEIDRLKLLQSSIRKNPSTLEKACEDYASLKSGALLSSLSRVTQRYLCYGGKAGNPNASACLYTEGGPLGEGGFNQFKTLKAVKHTKCSTRGSRSLKDDTIPGQIQDSTSPECRTLYEKYVSPLVEAGEEWNPSTSRGEGALPIQTPPVLEKPKGRKSKRAN